MNWLALSGLKKTLDGYRPLPSELVKNLEQWFKIELTYTSNALEGNTLTRQETAVVVEKGLTVGGKTLVEHLEATNHARAYQQILAIAGRRGKTLSAEDILTIHEAILKGIDDHNAGCYRSVMVRISGSQVILPNHIKVPDLMDELVSWMKKQKKIHPVELAAEAHYQLVTIHPFTDGNGRTARLLMNLLLIQHGYPPALIRSRDRLKYIQSLEQAQLGGSKEDYYKLMHAAVKRSFGIYLRALSGEQDSPETPLLKIGEVSKRSGRPVPSIRHWIQSGLIEVSDKTPSGYQLFDDGVLQQIDEIRRLQSERYSLAEIKQILGERY